MENRKVIKTVLNTLEDLKTNSGSTKPTAQSEINISESEKIFENRRKENNTFYDSFKNMLNNANANLKRVGQDIERHKTNQTNNTDPNTLIQLEREFNFESKPKSIYETAKERSGRERSGRERSGRKQGGRKKKTRSKKYNKKSKSLKKK
jgi:hypothetical protein